MNKLLIVSNYFPPERGAASNRIGRLAAGLAERGYDVKVVCPMPNYPEGKIFDGYTGKLKSTEKIGNVSVTRLWIYPSKSANPLVRILSIASFAVCLKLYLLFARLPKTVVVQSPPLLLSFLSVMILRLRRRKVVLNISDLWPLAAVELGALKENTIGHKTALFLEKFIYTNADTIIGQSREILQHVEKYIPGKSSYLYRNFPEHFAMEIPRSNGKVKIFYAGLLGVAQGVLEACRNIAHDPRFELHIFGDGAEREQIVSYISQSKSGTVFFHGMVAQKELAQKISSFDIAFVPLRTRIYGSVPSKIFEYSAQGFPVLYCGGGEGADIVRELLLGWVCEPGDYAALNQTIDAILQMPHEALEHKKLQVLETARKEFDIKKQLDDLAAKGAFQ